MQNEQLPQAVFRSGNDLASICALPPATFLQCDDWSLAQILGLPPQERRQLLGLPSQERRGGEEAEVTDALPPTSDSDEAV